MNRSIGSDCLLMAASCLLLTALAGDTSAQHLNIKPLAVATEPSARGLDFATTSAEPLPTGLSIRDASVIRERTPQALPADGRHRFQNWMVVSALGVCFTFGLIMTLSAIRSQPSEMPLRIL